MKAPNAEQREALARLRFDTSNGKRLLEYLDEWLAESTTGMALDNDAYRVRLWQGEVRALRYLLELLKSER